MSASKPNRMDERIMGLCASMHIQHLAPLMLLKGQRFHRGSGDTTSMPTPRAEQLGEVGISKLGGTMGEAGTAPEGQHVLCFRWGDSAKLAWILAKVLGEGVTLTRRCKPRRGRGALPQAPREEAVTRDMLLEEARAQHSPFVYLRWEDGHTGGEPLRPAQMMLYAVHLACRLAKVKGNETALSVWTPRVFADKLRDFVGGFAQEEDLVDRDGFPQDTPASPERLFRLALEWNPPSDRVAGKKRLFGDRKGLPAMPVPPEQQERLLLMYPPLAGRDLGTVGSVSRAFQEVVGQKLNQQMLLLMCGLSDQGQ